MTSPERREHYQREGLWDDSTLAGRVATHAASAPDAVAVIDAGGRHTRRELYADAASIAGWMAGRGIGPGSVVSIQLPNRYEFVAAAVAVQSLGAVTNPLLPNYRSRELENVFTTSRPEIILTPGEYRSCDYPQMIAEVSSRSGVEPLHVVVGPGARPGGLAFEELIGGSGRPNGLGPGRAEAVSEIIFTSGTEARPKAIMHTEQTANFSVRVARADLGVGADDVVWMPSPLGHSTGFNYGMRFALYHGLPLVLQDAWDPNSAVTLVEAERCSYTLAATTFLRDLVGEASRRGARLETLRFFGCGGSPVPAPLVAAAADVGIGVLRLYGSTEVLVATWNRPDSPADRLRDSDGMPMSHVEIKVCDEDGRPVAPGCAGELYVRGPNTCVGFFDDPERTRTTFLEGGWVRSGDLVAVGEDDHLTVVGRRKEIIIRGGMNITPREIEEMLLDFDEVEQAAVVGLPDDRLGERMCACVVLAAGRTLDLETAVTRFEAQGVATYKLPERMAVCESLPMTASGKIQKHVLVAELTGASGD